MLSRNKAQFLEMPQNHQFIESLIEVRSHYQSLQDEYERFSSHATEQLNHVNALLVDQFSENQQFVDNLLQLRSHYQELYQEHQQKAVRAKEQLNHVNALLADQAVLQHSEQQPISIQAATLEQQALTGAMPSAESFVTIADNNEESHRQSPEVVQEPETSDASELQITKDISQEEQNGALIDYSEKSPQQEPEVLKEPESPEASELQIPTDFSQGEQDEAKQSFPEPEPLVASVQRISTDSSQLAQHSELEPTIESPDVEDSSERSRYSPQLKTPLLPQYEHLKKSEAVEKLLQENEGNILHVDYIIRTLYGELEPEDIKAEKPRMNDSLKKGVAKGLWDRVPDSPGCYTVDLKLVEKKVESLKVEDKKPQKRKSSSKAVEGMLPRYRNMNFTEAVETVVRDRAGEILTPEIVTRTLYGDLSGQAFTQAKTHVGKTLWSGANQKRWKSVPGRLGAYTLTLEGK